MEVKDLQPRQGKVDIVIQVFEKGDTRQFEKFGKKGKVCSAKAKDGTGEIILSLWNEQVEEVNIGDKIHITNGYVGEYQGEKQLTTGKFGKLEILEKAAAAPQENAEAAPEKTEEEPVVYTNAPPEEFNQEKDQLKKLAQTPTEELSEEPIDDEEYIG